MSIPGIPGAPKLTFRTRDRVYVSLDQVIVELCEELAGEGLVVSRSVAKTVVQCARCYLRTDKGPQGLDEISGAVHMDLRGHRILLVPHRVRQVLTAYGRVYASLQIEDVTEQEATG